MVGLDFDGIHKKTGKVRVGWPSLNSDVMLGFPVESRVLLLIPLGTCAWNRQPQTG